MKQPSPSPSGHPLPQGERVSELRLRLRSLPELAKEQQERRKSLPSPLAGEGVSHRLTGEWFAKREAKRLRHDMTDAETKMWHALRGKRFEGLKFRRQVAVGRYIADFLCYSDRLIVEVDGSQHEESRHDENRDAWLASQGFRVLRFWNKDVLVNLDGALLTMLDAVKQPSPATLARGTLSREGRGKEQQP